MTVGLIGAPHDANSSFVRGPALAPDIIRRVMHNGAANLTSESGVDLSAPGVLEDLGNMSLADSYEGVMGVTEALSAIIDRGLRPLTLGGDHAISWPAVRAVHAAHGPVDILHFDAHADIYPDFDNNRYSHASPFARIVEEGLAGRLVQVGIRTLTDVQRDMIKRHGVETHPWRGEAPLPSKLQFERPIYISIDIDALDPAFAPGVSHHEPGGMSVGDVLAVLQSLEGKVVGADVVEYNPRRDWQDMTAMVCVKFVKELAALLSR
ncbi:MAG: agmatinase family protein [Pseudomonadota bacterium]